MVKDIGVLYDVKMYINNQSYMFGWIRSMMLKPVYGPISIVNVYVNVVHT